MTVKVLTLNIWNTSGPWPERAKRIHEWLDHLDPDIIGFQEVLRGDGIDQLGELVGDRGYHTDFVEAVRYWNDASLSFGNAIASRWPIADRETLRLPDAGDTERRAA